MNGVIKMAMKKTKSTTFETWNSISGPLKFWTNQYGNASMIQNKEKEKLFFNVQFKKGVEFEKGENNIKINHGFFSTYKSKDGSVKLKLVVTDFEE